MDRFERWYLDAGMSTFPLQDLTDRCRKPDHIRVPVHMYDVVGIPGSASFGERTKFLPEQFRD